MISQRKKIKVLTEAGGWDADGQAPGAEHTHSLVYSRSPGSMVPCLFPGECLLGASTVLHAEGAAGSGWGPVWGAGGEPSTVKPPVTTSHRTSGGCTCQVDEGKQ